VQPTDRNIYVWRRLIESIIALSPRFAVLILVVVSDMKANGLG
jgi:hypothetical protein